jgi:hypothetical protein
MKQKILTLTICLLLISFIPPTLATKQTTSEPSQPTGYGIGKIFGILPRITGDNINVIMLIPQLGEFTIAKTRFNGHLGIFFIFGDYQWYADAPPAYSNLKSTV